MQSLVVIGRRWFDKVNGNTYHTAEILIDGLRLYKSERTYGYDQQYLHTARTWLETNGYATFDGHHEHLWRWAERVGVTFSYSVTDVARKGDL